jgi:hypothetical protein
VSHIDQFHQGHTQTPHSLWSFLPEKSVISVSTDSKQREVGYLGKQIFELSNHLGNVLATITDKKLQVSTNTTSTAYFEADVQTVQDYYVFGMQMPGRKLSGGYRYGFNTQEKVDEIAGSGNHYTSEHWEMDPRTGRRWNLDPVPQIAISDYAVNRNNPIYYNDPDGDCPNCITAAIGAGVGALIGGGIEIGMQLYNNGSVNNWSAVGGSAAQGFVTGGAAGFTGGASLLVTAGVAGGANVVGGAINNKIQGKPVTVVSTATDLLVGAAFGALGYGAKALYTKTLANRVSSIFSSAPKNASLSNTAAREWYLSQESKIVGLLDKTKSLEEQAKQASGLRNAFRTKARELMSDTEEAARLMRDEQNMSWDKVVAKYSEGGKYSGDKLWNRIIEATQRSRASVNESLGVKPKK